MAVSFFRYYCIAFLAFSLFGCATQNSPTQLHHMAWPKRYNQLNELQTWNIEGAVSVIHDGEVTTGSFEWEQHYNDYSLVLYAPLGMGSIRLTGDSTGVDLWQSDVKHIHADDPEKLLQANLGWSLPINNLLYWIRGLPSPKTPYSTTFDNYMHLKKMHQQQWLISFDNYTSHADTDLPHKLKIASKKSNIKIAIHSWNT